MQSSLAKKMRMLRAREGWGLVQASQILGINRHTLRDLELGKREPRYATLRNIASVYGIGLDELIKKPTQFDLPFPKAIMTDSRWCLAPWRYRAAVIEVESPRVVWCHIDFGMREYTYRHITILGYKTPHISEGSPEDREAAGKGKRFLEELLMNRQVAVITEHPDYGARHPYRWCARILHVGNRGNCEDLAETMIRSGHGQVIPIEESA